MTASHLHSTGKTATVTSFAEIPPKEEGRHRWIVSVAYTLTPSQASAWHAGSAVNLEAGMVMHAGMGCVDCEQEYADVVAERCPAGDTWGTAPDTVVTQ